MRMVDGARSSRELVSMWVRVDGMRMHARVSCDSLPASAPTIVLVHGIAVSHRYLLPLAERLAPHARVYLPDLPGYGRSDKPPLSSLSVPSLSDALVAWMDAVGLERPHMLGNSFGCQVLADLAVKHPERVRRLVLQGPSIDPRARSVSRQVGRWLVSGLFERKSEVGVLLRDFLDLGPRRLAGMVRIGLRDQIEAKLPHIAAPTLVIRGSRDAIVPQRWAEEATRLLPHGRLVVVEGAAHTINYSQPERLRDIVLQFLVDESRSTPASTPSRSPVA